jgi:hypothetical protein
MGEVLSCDEQDIGFTGRHQDKQQVNDKDEGDGFSTDLFCQDEYTYSFYFHNMPAPKKYIDEGYSPTHSRVLFLFDLLKEKKHILGLVVTRCGRNLTIWYQGNMCIFSSGTMSVTIQRIFLRILVHDP